MISMAILTLYSFINKRQKQIRAKRNHISLLVAAVTSYPPNLVALNNTNLFSYSSRSQKSKIIFFFKLNYFFGYAGASLLHMGFL